MAKLRTSTSKTGTRWIVFDSSYVPRSVNWTSTLEVHIDPVPTVELCGNSPDTRSKKVAHHTVPWEHINTDRRKQTASDDQFKFEPRLLASHEIFKFESMQMWLHPVCGCGFDLFVEEFEFLALLPASTDDTGSELTSPAPTASSAFRHTSHLLAGVLSALLVDKTEWIMTHYDMAFSTISRAAYVSHIETPDATQLDIERLQVSRRWDGPKAKQFFERGAFRVAIASLADHGQPGSGAIIWGMVNDRRDREEELGWLIPVLNWAMCEEYENTFVNDDDFTPDGLSSEEKKTAEQLEDTLLSRRALLGTLIALTFIHEAMHSYVHWRLADAIDPTTFNRIFNTTDEKGKPDPGWLLESHLFHGSFQVQMALANIKNIDRFTQIEDVYLQDRDTVDSISTHPSTLGTRSSPPDVSHARGAGCTCGAWTQR
ncbi:hypothetical protein C8R46DRAFT_1038362 [Mycena filopes]|nr:hypothetical protein C8R46DRAFT_1038362 [Mycena filopes]